MEFLFPLIIRILVPAALAFMLGMLITPIVSHYLYRFKAWKKIPGKTSLDGTIATEFNRLHQINEMRAPRMGGIVVWVSVLLTITGIDTLAQTFQNTTILKLDFLSRSQTLIPVTTLIIGAIAGLVDDILVIRPGGQGLRLRWRLLVVIAASLAIGLWFYLKLDINAVNVPFAEPLIIGWLVVPLFVCISLSLYASGVIDGIDGLSGGVFASIFASYAIIAFAQNQMDLAAFSMAVVGALLAFLWFNIPPARFYMSDTGTMALTLTIGAIAFMTDVLGGGYGISVLPIIGGLLVITVASDILQIIWKRVFGRKLLRIAPLHHHFEAVGWSGAKIVMRYWIMSIVFAALGVILALSALH